MVKRVLRMLPKQIIHLFFAFIEYIPLEIALDLTKKLASLPRAAPWQSALLHFTKIYQMLRTHKSFQPFKVRA